MRRNVCYNESNTTGAAAIADWIDHPVCGKKLSETAEELLKRRSYQDAPLYRKENAVKGEDGEEN